MLRLLRTAFVLFGVNIVCVIIVIVARYSDTAWGCLAYISRADRNPLLDLTTGNFLPNESLTYSSAPIRNLPNMVARNIGDKLLYSYLSPKNVRRIGIVNSQPTPSHVYLDFAETSTHLAAIDLVSPNSRFFSLVVTDWAQHTRSITLYDTSTLAPLVSVTQVQVHAALPSGQYFSSAWSPDGSTYSFISLVADKPVLTVLAPNNGTSFSAPLPANAYFVSLQWTSTGNALAATDSNHSLIDIFASTDGDWTNVASYHLNVETDKEQLFVSRWLLDQHSLLLQKKLAFDPSPNPKIDYLRFSLTTQRLEAVDEKIFYPTQLHLRESWLCDNNYAPNQSALVPVSGEHPPILLDQTFGGCILADNPLGTKLIALGQPEANAQKSWIGLAADPNVDSASIVITPLTIPSTATSPIQWLDNDSKVLFFLPSTTQRGERTGQVGILDVNTQAWVLIPEMISIGKLITVSPDFTRFTIAAADEQYFYLFTSQGDLLATIPASAKAGFSVSWTLDSAKFLFLDFVGDIPPTILLTTFDRDGNQLASIRQPKFDSAIIVGWTRCNPSPKLPRLSLPS